MFCAATKNGFFPLFSLGFQRCSENANPRSLKRRVQRAGKRKRKLWQTNFFDHPRKLTQLSWKCICTFYFSICQPSKTFLHLGCKISLLSRRWQRTKTLPNATIATRWWRWCSVMIWMKLSNAVHPGTKRCRWCRFYAAFRAVCSCIFRTSRLTLPSDFFELSRFKLGLVTHFWEIFWSENDKNVYRNVLEYETLGIFLCLLCFPIKSCCNQKTVKCSQNATHPSRTQAPGDRLKQECNAQYRETQHTSGTHMSRFLFRNIARQFRSFIKIVSSTTICC